jgi:hypothetical protein
MNAREKFVYQYYLNKGLSPTAAAAITGNLSVESDGFASDVIAGQRRGDRGSAHYVQQLRGERLTNFRQYAKSKGLEETTLETQLDFVLEEMDPASPFKDNIAAANRDKILNSTDVDEATQAFARYYERPNMNLAHMDRRTAIAQAAPTKPVTRADLTNMPINPPTPAERPTELASLEPSPGLQALVPSQRSDLASFLTSDKGPSHVDGLKPEFKARLEPFLRSVGDTQIYSGYRSPAHQARLYARALDKYGSHAAARKWVAPPGGSNHNRGIAADLRYGSGAARAKAHREAESFGLNFRMNHEPWHVEPIKGWDRQVNPEFGLTPQNPPIPFSEDNLPVAEPEVMVAETDVAPSVHPILPIPDTPVSEPEVMLASGPTPPDFFLDKPVHKTVEGPVDPEALLETGPSVNPGVLVEPERLLEPVETAAVVPDVSNSVLDTIPRGSPLEVPEIQTAEIMNAAPSQPSILSTPKQPEAPQAFAQIFGTQSAPAAPSQPAIAQAPTPPIAVPDVPVTPADMQTAMSAPTGGFDIGGILGGIASALGAAASRPQPGNFAEQKPVEGLLPTPELRHGEPSTPSQLAQNNMPVLSDLDLFDEEERRKRLDTGPQLSSLFRPSRAFG